MKKIANDQDALMLIAAYYKGLFHSEDQRDELLDKLEDYQSGLSNELTQSKYRLEPEEALRIARERNKPIIL